VLNLDKEDVKSVLNMLKKIMENYIDKIKC